LSHFARPQFFISIVPTYLPYPATLVAVSGAAEILGAIGLLIPRTRRFSAWGLIALYICVFPANVNMALQPGQYPAVLLWLRLPFQGVLIAWAYWVGLHSGPGPKVRAQGKRRA
jgi:uncharacterized membrane protein